MKCVVEVKNISEDGQRGDIHVENHCVGSRIYNLDGWISCELLDDPVMGIAVNTLIDLKEAGFSAEDIIMMNKAGLV